MSNAETVSGYIALDWHDGPLLEIARVDFPDRDRMVQVQSLCTVSGVEPWTRAVIRLSRSDLQAMIDLLDGKPVRDCTDA